MTPDQQIKIRNHQRAVPVDITALATSLGLIVYDDETMSSGISGMITRDAESPSGYTIAVNANDHYFRRRFTIAHECAHFLKHKAQIGDGITDDPMYRSELNSQYEFEANNLAADLLMPKHLVLPRIKGGSEDVSGLAEDFQVSVAAMKVRLRYLYRFDYVTA